MGGGGGVPINNQDKTITQNGTYTADEGFTGLGTVKVSVARDDQTDVLNAVIARSITEISSNATSIGNYAFYGCSKLTTANFPAVTSIGENAFKSCSNLTTVNFPVATHIRANAFDSCSNLTTADFGPVANINTNAFRYCSKLTTLILRSETMCALGNTGVFNSTPITSGGTGYIYVPRALVDSYKSATNWSNFASQFRALEDYTVDGTITGELDGTKI